MVALVENLNHSGGSIIKGLFVLRLLFSPNITQKLVNLPLARHISPEALDAASAQKDSAKARVKSSKGVVWEGGMELWAANPLFLSLVSSHFKIASD